MVLTGEVLSYEHRLQIYGNLILKLEVILIHVMSGVLETNGSCVNDVVGIALLVATSLAQTAGVSLRVVLIGGVLAVVLMGDF